MIRLEFKGGKSAKNDNTSTKLTGLIRYKNQLNI